MQRIGPIVQPSNTLEETAQRVSEAPALQTYLAALSRSGRSKLRSRLVARGYSAEQVAIIAPHAKGGRPATAGGGTFEGLSRPVRSAIADALGLDAFPVSVDSWNSAETASAAADAIINHYDNPTSITTTLTLLRNGLKALGIPEEVWKATLRPDITRRHNQSGETRRVERADEGLDIPDAYKRIADLRTRVQGYLADGISTNDTQLGQVAADLLVTLSARPGEAESLVIGARGGIRGVLKKRGVDGSYNLVSALGTDVARNFLQLWREAPLAQRTRAMRDMGTLVRAWGIQRRDLRAIGAHLAARAAVLAGSATNSVSVRDVRRAALRHSKPQAREAIDHYARVNDPVAQMSAKLSELSVSDLARVKAILEKAE